MTVRLQQLHPLFLTLLQLESDSVSDVGLIEQYWLEQ